MKVDYHLHTNCSDGTLSVSELVSLASQMQLTHIAICDHDTLDGQAIAKKLVPETIHVTTGIEITVREEIIPGYSTPCSIHLLGYHIHEQDCVLQTLLKERKQRVNDVFDQLFYDVRGAGLSLTRSPIPRSCANVLQLSDIVQHVFAQVPSIDHQWIQHIEQYAETLSAANIGLQEGIDAIHHAGGIAIWAHPFHIYQKFQKCCLLPHNIEAMKASLIAAGIDGLEALYYDFDETQQAF